MKSAPSVAVFGLLALTACQPPAPVVKTYPVLVHAATEDGDPLAQIDILARDAVVGQTSAEGTLLAQLHGDEGMDVTFVARCPEGSKPVGSPPSLRLRTLSAQARPEVEVVCGRDRRMAALLVSTPGFGGLPVLVHDREVGRTDASGVAHVLLQGDPATPLRVVLDTRSRPTALPASPHRDLQIGTRDEIVVFAPELTEPKKVEKKPRRVVKKPVAPPPVFRPEKLR